MIFFSSSSFTCGNRVFGVAIFPLPSSYQRLVHAGRLFNPACGLSSPCNCPVLWGLASLHREGWEGYFSAAFAQRSCRLNRGVGMIAYIRSTFAKQVYGITNQQIGPSLRHDVTNGC